MKTNLENSSAATAIQPFTACEELRRYYRYPSGMIDVYVPVTTGKTGFFRAGSARCFGSCSLPDPEERIGDLAQALPDAITSCVADSGAVRLSFNPDEVAANLRLERYTAALAQGRKKLLNASWVRQGYYLVRRLLPVHVRKHLQRRHLADWKRIPFPGWPVDTSVDQMFEQILRLALSARSGDPIPFVWFWPDGHAGCMIMTHDVEEARGRDLCSGLMDLDESAGLRSSFQVIPEVRYDVPARFLDEIRNRGHEVNVHDLNHDGNLFREREEFLRRAAKIRSYAVQFAAQGFRSGVLYRNQDWFDDLGFSYDMSVPNTAHLDPQRGGCCTVMPYFIGRVLELPLTTTQDYSLFHVLQDYSLGLWEKQIDMILHHHGLISFNVHPDYIVEKRERDVYVSLLSMLARLRDTRDVWAALPRDVNRWWRQRSQLELVRDGEHWRIAGDGAERASVAYASLEDGHLVYRRS
jgi:hypothetical protein